MSSETPPPGPCSLCNCAQYYPMTASNRSAQGECACRHDAEDHQAAPPLPSRYCNDGVAFSPIAGDSPLDPRGTCMNCGQPWYTHNVAPVAPAAAAPMSQPQPQPQLAAPTGLPPIPARPVHYNSTIRPWVPPAHLPPNVSGSMPPPPTASTWVAPSRRRGGGVSTPPFARSSQSHPSPPSSNGRAHGSFAPVTALAPGVSPSTSSASRSRDASLSHNGKAQNNVPTRYQYVVCLHTEDPTLSKRTQTGRFFRPKYSLRVPESHHASDGFIRRFRAVNLAFDFEVIARASIDFVGGLLAGPLDRHMQANGLELRRVNPQQDSQAREDDTASMSPSAWFGQYWGFMEVKSNGRVSQLGGPPFQPWARPHGQVLNFEMLNKAMSRVPSFSPPNNGRLLILLYPVDHVLVGPWAGDSTASERPLHLCLGLRAWPVNQVITEDDGSVLCVEGCGTEILTTTDTPTANNDTSTSGSNTAPSARPTSAAPNFPPSAQSSLDPDSDFLPDYDHDLEFSESTTFVPSSASYTGTTTSVNPSRPGDVASASGSRSRSNIASGSRSNIAVSHSLDAAPRSLDAAPRSLDAAPRSLDAAPRSLDAAPRSLDAAPRSLDIASRSRSMATATAASRSASAPLSVATTEATSSSATTSSSPAVAPTTSESGLAWTLRYLQRAEQAVQDWLAVLRSYQPDIPHGAQGVHISAGTVAEAAEGLLAAALRYVSDDQHNGDTESSEPVDVINFNDTGLEVQSPTFSVGRAIGPGPLRAVFSEAMRRMVQGSLWSRASDDQFYIPAIPDRMIRPTPNTLQQYRACGVMLRLALLWGQDILPVSPMLLALLLGDFRAASDQELMRCISPELYARMQTWPPPRIRNPLTGAEEYDVEMGREPMNMIIQIGSFTQISHIRALQVDGVDNVANSIAAGLLFTTLLDNVEEGHLHPIYEAIRDGLDQQDLVRSHLVGGELPASSTLIKTFEGFSIPLIVAGLCANRRVTSYAQLIPLLTHRVLVHENHPGYDASLDYRALAERWMECLQRYLSGIGHPNHPAFAALGQTASTMLEAYRPTLFLMAISDSQLLPRGAIDNNGHEDLRIQFVSAHMEEGRHANAWFHTCMLTMDVVIDQSTAEILVQELPDDPSVTTDFDYYIHSLLLHSSDGYDTL